MKFYLEANQNKRRKLRGQNPEKLYIPLNAGREVGSAKKTRVGGFSEVPPAEQVELGSWIETRVSDGTIAVKDTSVSALSATTTLTASTSDAVYLVDASGGAVTVKLPDPSTVSNKITIKKTDAAANDVTVDAHASETIDGAATDTISTQYESASYVTDGTNWFSI